MKLLVAPVHQFISEKSLPQNSRAFGSEYARAHDYLLRVSSNKNISGDAVVGYSDLTSMGNIRIHSLYKAPLSYVSNISRFMFPIRVFFKSLTLMKKNRYDCIWHLGPFGFNKTFNLLAILKLQHSRFILGPVLTPLNTVGIHGKEKVTLAQKVDGYIYDKLSDIFKCLSLITLRRAETIIVVENAGLNILKSFGIHSGKILHLGMSDNGFRSKPRSLKSKTISLLYVGYLIDRKRVEDLILAIKCLVDHGVKNISLKIAGDGPMKNKMQELINQNNLSDYVFMLGQVPRSKVFDLYKDADIFVAGSILESMPSMYFEALASSLPMVIAENNSSNELKNDNFGGFVVPGIRPDKIAAAIMKLIDNPKLYREMSLRNHKLSETTYNFENQMQKLLSIING